MISTCLATPVTSVHSDGSPSAVHLYCQTVHCSFDLNKLAQAQGDKAARKQYSQLRNAAMDSLAEVGAAALSQLHAIKFIL